MMGAMDGKMQVVVTGVGAAIARDVMRLLAADGASVIAAGADSGDLSRLERDLGLFRTPLEIASVDLSNSVEVRLWESSLRAFGRLPHLMVCCCGSPASTPTQRAACTGTVGPNDVALDEGTHGDCVAALARRVLQPTLFLHAAPLRRSAFDRALAALRHPTLRGVLERAPGEGVFNPRAVIPYVRIASHLYSVSRGNDGETAPTQRLCLRAPGQPVAGRPEAARPIRIYG